MSDPAGGRPCTGCGAEVSPGRSVCPSCGTFQALGPTRGPAAPEHPPASAPPPAHSFDEARPAPTVPPLPPGSGTGSTTRSPSRLIVAAVAVAALVAGAYLVFGSGSSDDNASPTADGTVPTTVPEPTSTTTTAAFTAPTTMEAIDTPWIDVTDEASGISFKLPGSTPSSVEQVPVDFLSTIELPTLYEVGPYFDGTSEVPFSVYVWTPSLAANQGTVDLVFQRMADRDGSANAPYPKALTMAGQPATVKDTSSFGRTTLTAVAAIDGSLVVIRTYGFDEPANAAVFEQVIASVTAA